MAPPAFNKRGPPPDPPDAGNRVLKTTSALNRLSGATISKPRSTPHSNIAFHKNSILEKRLGVEQFLIDDQADKIDMVIEPEELPIDTTSSDPFESTTESSKNKEKYQSITLLMDSIKGLLDLTNPNLKKSEEEHPDVGTGFMALLVDGASRAMHGERVYSNLSNILSPNPKIS